MHATLPLLEVTDFPEINRTSLQTMQVNIGYLCNLRCLHCHVAAGPHRKEMMDDEAIDSIVPIMRARGMKILDLTGGAPEMHWAFKRLVKQAYDAGIKVIDRCNLTILMEPGYEDMAEFLADHKVEVVASMPCYSVDNVDKQRGEGVFDKSIAGLQLLNKFGYGMPGSDLTLNLVYNPLGPSLPPNQQALEADYKRELKKHFDIEFDQLFALANMPIQRFGSMLISKGQFEDYMNLLKDNFSAGNLESVMCKTTISVDYQGYLYDCDFNQQLGLDQPLTGRKHLKELYEDDLAGEPIRIADHCYGCTAGQGSSCGGAL